MKGLLKTYTELDQIIAFLQDETGEVKLSTNQQQKWERVDFCDNLLRQYSNSTQRVLPMIMKKYDVSKDTAYRIINDTRKVYGTLARVDKDYWRPLLADEAHRMMLTCYKNGEFKSAAMFQRNLIDIVGLTKDDPEIPDFTDIPRNNYLIVTDPSVLGLPAIDNLEELMEQFKKRKKVNDITDVDFEDVK